MRQNQPAGDDAHNAFKTQDQRSHGRIDAALADDLKRVGDAVAADTCVEEGGSGCLHGFERGRFEDHHQDEAQDASHKELNAAHAHAVDVVGVVVDYEDVSGVAKRASQHQAVAEAQGEFSGRHAEVIEPKARKHDRNPHQKARLATDEHADDRNDDDVQARQKSRFAHRGVEKSELLQRFGNKKHDAAENAARPDLGISPRVGFFACCLIDLPARDPIQNRQHRQQKQSADDGARKRKGKRSDVIHAEGLRDEGGAPDDGAQEKNETVAYLKRHDGEVETTDEKRWHSKRADRLFRTVRKGEVPAGEAYNTGIVEFLLSEI